MSEGRSRERWTHTSMVLSLIANVNRDPKKGRAFTPSDFDPWATADRRSQVVTKDDLTMLRWAMEARKGTRS